MSPAVPAAGTSGRVGAAARTGPVVVLVGPPASGKSTVLLLLAQALGVAPRDTDQDVEAGAGTSVAEIFAAHGEQEFRAREAAAVAAALTGHAGVLALGGGAVLDPATRARLAEYGRAGGVVVFLDVTPEQVADRIAADTTRPLLAGDALARWRELMAARRALYEEVATVRVATGRPARDVAREIVEHVARAGRVHQGTGEA